MKTKTCKKCGEEFPLTTEFFSRNAQLRDGFTNTCKACVNANSKRWYEANRERRLARCKDYREENPERERARCREYAKEHPEKARARNRKYRTKMGERWNAYQREWRKAHPEQTALYTLRWKERHPESYRASIKRRYWTNRARRLAYSREYQRLHREEITERKRRYNSERPDVMRAHEQRRRAYKIGLPAVYSADHWRAALDYFEGKCAVCGRPVGFFHTLAADHWVPLSSPECPGTVVTNIVPLCHGIDGCNNRKHARPARAWLVEQFGARKAKQIEKRIADFFAHMVGQFPLESDGQYGEGAERPHQTRFDGHRHAGNHPGGQ